MRRLLPSLLMLVTVLPTLAGLSPVRAQGAATSPPSTAPSRPEAGDAQGGPRSPGDQGIVLRLSEALLPPVRGDAARTLPIVLQARSLVIRPDRDTVAEGNTDFRRGALVIRADQLRYDQPEDLAVASGQVSIRRDGNLYTGPELQLKIQRFEGFFLSPSYHFSRAGAGGSARRVDFIDERRVVATAATYSSCLADGTGTPDWMLTTDRVSLDFDANEGVAENGVLRFYGVPILGAPRLSFPITDARKSGWLPPSVGLDSKSGVITSIPYYWNIAPNRDATLMPTLSTRRGAGLDSEFRYLEPGYGGSARLNLLPSDQLAGRSRYAFTGLQENELGGRLGLQARILRVSDSSYWKDFPGDVASPTPRLLASDLQLSRAWGDWATYVNIKSWQALQTLDPATRFEAPYDRLPQVGARLGAPVGTGFELELESEINRFANPQDASLLARTTGVRWHALGSLSRPFVSPGWTVTPRLSFNAAAYALDPVGATPGLSPRRLIPTLSLDSAWVFERDTEAFGRDLQQTLEPRLRYVKTSYRDQTGLPNFDAYAKDFNFDSIFTDNTFSGVDRVSDSHQLTAGVTTRLIDPKTGAEQFRFGAAQRYLLSDQRVTPDDKPLTQHLSDLLFLASTTLVPAWSLESSVQYSPDVNRVSRSVLSARYSPGPFRTVSATYRLTRGLSEQVEVGWQWPLYGRTPDESQASQRAGGSPSCGGSLYGVGRVNYSTLERRVIDSIVGLEYDAGCWVGRVVATRLSTGRTEATTRLSVQLEFVGLSRLNLGSNPLQVLKDNIPGFRLLRDGRAVGEPTSAYD